MVSPFPTPPPVQPCPLCGGKVLYRGPTVIHCANPACANNVTHQDIMTLEEIQEPPPDEVGRYLNLLNLTAANTGNWDLAMTSMLQGLTVAALLWKVEIPGNDDLAEFCPSTLGKKLPVHHLGRVESLALLSVILHRLAEKSPAKQ